MVCSSCRFFFFKQKTAYEMRISDWSSDVCSSDLLKTRVGRTGAPLLEDCVAWIECEMEAIHPGGDHDIFVGRVVGIEAALAGRPLLYFGGGYRRIEPDEID